MSDNSEVIVYQTNDGNLKMNVRLEEETVWLTQMQMVELFQSTKQNVSLHINNAVAEGELDPNSVVKEYLTTAADGKNYRTKHYNLDAIISVGYRVKSLRGTQFRIWANKILRDYLLKGYSINNRMNRIEDSVEALKCRVNEIDLQINTHLIPTQGVFSQGQIFDAYVFATNLIKSATKTIILIDNYIDEKSLLILSKRNKGVSAEIYTKQITAQMKLDLEKHNSQYEPIKINKLTTFHDRFVIVDGVVYHIGASLKDLGKDLFAFSRINIKAEKLLDSV
ncbi:MAG: virulence RhuM family protein [Chitinivibrionia bacterium]|nr:virulence RhuM family protein [Chitinivibrionia bacterium]